MKYKKIIIIIFSFSLLALIIKLFFGQISIKLTIPFDNPTYRVLINDSEVGLDIETQKKNIIIPSLINICYKSWFYLNGESELLLNFGEPIILSVSSYQCYSDITGELKITQCNSDNSNKTLQEIDNVEYYKLKIMGGSTIGISNTVIYEGDYVNDITDFLKSPGIYQIIIYARHNNYESQILMKINLEKGE